MDSCVAKGARTPQMQRRHATVVPAFSAAEPRPSKRCACFQICGEEGLAAFHLSLPCIHDLQTSPWRHYLRAVYGHGGRIPTPLCLSSLEAFYPSLMPTQPCCFKHCLARCSDCEGWLAEGRPPPKQILREYALNRSIVTIYDKRGRLGAWWDSTAIIIQRQTREAFPDNEWVEVARTRAWRNDVERATFPEGSKQYGCWFIVARGTGVFVNVRRTLVLQTRSVVDTAAANLTLTPFGTVWNEIPRYVDWQFARGTRSGGYDSLQILYGNPHPFGKPTRPVSELILVDKGCMSGKEPLPDACAPVEARGGWHADRPCQCVEGRPVMNCGLDP